MCVYLLVRQPQRRTNKKIAGSKSSVGFSVIVIATAHRPVDVSVCQQRALPFDCIQPFPPEQLILPSPLPPKKNCVDLERVSSSVGLQLLLLPITTTTTTITITTTTSVFCDY